MPSTYTTRLRLTLPATGELTNLWGGTVNTGITELVDASIAGAATLSTWGGAGVAYTLSNNNGVADEARCMFIVASGSPGEAKNIICPAVSKLYVVRNSVSGGFSVTLKTAAGTGVTVENGRTAILRCDGTNVVDAITQLPAFAVAGGTANQVQYLNASKELAGSANLTFNGTTLTANSATVSTGNLNFSSTAQRITGDMSNATQSNRIAFQSSTTNGNTGVNFVPNGTSTTASLVVFNTNNPDSSAFGHLSATATEVSLSSSRTGVSATLLPMIFQTGGSERVRIDTSGNVGIGTASPSSRLDVRTSAAEIGRFSSSAANGGYQIFYPDNVTTPVYVGSQKAILSTGNATDFAIVGTGANNMVFGTNGAERMRIDSSGNVGIGTASPGVKLDVSGSSIPIKFTSSDNSYVLTLAYTGGSSTSYIGTFSNGLVFAPSSGTTALTITSTGGITSANLADAVGYKGTPLNEQSTAYTLVIGDMGKSIVHPASDNNARTFTIPANGTVAFPVGTTITFINMINTVTIAITTDTMYLAGTGTTGSRTLAAYGMATAVKMTSTTWIISGNGLT